MQLMGLYIGLMVGLAVYVASSVLFIAISDTILVCFLESPEKLRDVDQELYDALSRCYSESLQDKLERIGIGVGERTESDLGQKM